MIWSLHMGCEGMNLDDVVPPPGAALVEDLDKRLLVQLRDGRKLIGILRHVGQSTLSIFIFAWAYGLCLQFDTIFLDSPIA